MAQRIDHGVHPSAHTAVLAMIVRAQQAADQTGKAVGVHYDLESDEVSLVEIGPDVPKDLTFLHVAAPTGGVAPGIDGTVAAGNEKPGLDVKSDVN